MTMRKKVKPIKNFRKGNTRGRNNNSLGKVTDAKTIEIVERRYQVMKLRRDGYTIKEIADALNTSVGTIAIDIKTILIDTIEKTAETVEQSREIQAQRLDALVKTYLPLATDSHKELRVDPLTGKDVIVELPPDPKYAQVVLSTEARRSRLLALDKPESKTEEESGIRVYVGVDVDLV
jgi:hypothetical protein